MTTKATLALLVALLALLLWLYRRDRAVASALQLDDFLLGDDGKASKSALVMYVALAVSSYVVVLYTVRGTLTDLLFGAYLAAWVAPTVTKLISSGAQPAAPTVAITAQTVGKIEGTP